MCGRVFPSGRKHLRVPFIFLLTLSCNFLSKCTNRCWSVLLFVWPVVVVNLCCFDRCTHRLQTQRTSTEIPPRTPRLNLPAVCLQALSLVSSKQWSLFILFFFYFSNPKRPEVFFLIFFYKERTCWIRQN